MTRPARRAVVLGLALAFLVSTLAAPAMASRAAAASRWTSQVQPREAVERFLVLWRIGDYRRMHDVLAAADRNHFTDAGFVAIHESLAQAVGLTGMDVAIGSPKLAVRPAEAALSGRPRASAAGPADPGAVGQPRSAHRPARRGVRPRPGPRGAR